MNQCNKLLLRDYTMVDKEPSLTVIELNTRGDKSLPSMGYSGVTWDAFGCVTGGLGGRRLHTNVATEINNNLCTFVESQVYKVPGFSYRPPASPADDGNRPVLPLDKFKHVVPTDDKFLPFKQEVIDKWNGLTAVSDEFQGLAKVHNDKHNPSHQPWRPNKRAAEQTPEMEDEQNALPASSLHQPPGTPTTKEALVTASATLSHKFVSSSVLLYLCLTCFHILFEIRELWRRSTGLLMCSSAQRPLSSTSLSSRIASSPKMSFSFIVMVSL